MEISAYLAPLKKWWWLLLAATLVAAVSSYVATLQQLPIYQAHTTLMIGRTIEDPNPTSSEFYLAQQLAASYADIANREPLRNATMDKLEMTWLPQYLARAIPNNQLIEIAVTDVNPLRAQVVANELANQLILRSPTATRPEDQERQEFINNQLDSLQTQIIETQDEIAKLQAELGDLNSARQIADTQTQITALQTKLATLQGNFAALLSNTQQGAANTLTVVEPADLPSKPIGPQKGLSILLASAIGLVLASLAAYLIEYLDDTLKTPADISKALDLPVIGYISEIKQQDGDGVYVSNHPRSPIAEAFRSLRNNLEFAQVETQIKTILVTGPEIAIGKTSVATNLAVILAQASKKVILMDADLRKPNLHSDLGIDNTEGLGNLFLGETDIGDVIHPWKMTNLAVITSGDKLNNPAELLSSKKMDRILARLKEVADFIIIDGPPFVVSDASILAQKVDGVLLVMRPGHTRKAVAQAMMEQIHRSGARVLGVTLNRITQRSAEYYGGFVYYSPYYSNGYYYEDGRGDEEVFIIKSLKTIQSLFRKLPHPFEKLRDNHNDDS